MSNEALLDSPGCWAWCCTPVITHRQLSQEAKPARTPFQDHVTKKKKIQQNTDLETLDQLYIKPSIYSSMYPTYYISDFCDPTKHSPLVLPKLPLTPPYGVSSQSFSVPLLKLFQ